MERIVASRLSVVLGTLSVVLAFRHKTISGSTREPSSGWTGGKNGYQGC
jgi:hypothetical protein